MEFRVRFQKRALNDLERLVRYVAQRQQSVSALPWWRRLNIARPRPRAGLSSTLGADFVPSRLGPTAFIIAFFRIGRRLKS